MSAVPYHQEVSASERFRDIVHVVQINMRREHHRRAEYVLRATNHFGSDGTPDEPPADIPHHIAMDEFNSTPNNLLRFYDKDLATRPGTKVRPGRPSNPKTTRREIIKVKKVTKEKNGDTITDEDLAFTNVKNKRTNPVLKRRKRSSQRPWAKEYKPWRGDVSRAIAYLPEHFIDECVTVTADRRYEDDDDDLFGDDGDE
jgi:hypothetical protein